tara:strand:- start:2486 stop:2836 length:351 start_codon:yes stop_codon:yes gene_type:complete
MKSKKSVYKNMDCDNYLSSNVFPKEKKSETQIENNKPREAIHSENNKHDKNTPEIKPDRCQVCNKKLRTCVLECKCKKVFCSAHISNTAHNCSFDYKALGKELVEKQNPKIVFEKL